MNVILLILSTCKIRRYVWSLKPISDLVFQHELFIFKSIFCQDGNLIQLFLFFQAKPLFGREDGGTNGSFLYQRVPNAGAFGTLIRWRRANGAFWVRQSLNGRGTPKPLWVVWRN